LQHVHVEMQMNLFVRFWKFKSTNLLKYQ